VRRPRLPVFESGRIETWAPLTLLRIVNGAENRQRSTPDSPARSGCLPGWHSQVLSAFGERDLLLFRTGERWGFEFKCSDAPAMTKSMHVALQDLALDRLFVIYPGKDRYRLHQKVEAIPLTDCMDLPGAEANGWRE